MNHPDKSAIPALVRVSEIQEFVTYLKQSLQDRLLANVKLSGEAGQRGQGRAEELIELIDYIESAPVVMKNNRDSREKAPSIARTAL